MNKVQKALLLVLVMQVALTGWIFWPQKSAAEGGSQLLAGYDAEKVSKSNHLGRERRSNYFA